MVILAPPLLQEIPLSEVLQVRGPAQLSVAPLPGADPHSFELVTASLVFCVQAGDEGAAWKSSICRALMPVQSSRGPGEQHQGESAGWFHLYVLVIGAIFLNRASSRATRIAF